jgi:septal ring factor EnvC (AmiA/AmiB activator)
MEKNVKKVNFLIISIIIVLLIWSISGLTIYLISDNWGDRGTIGDMFGAVNALFSGLAFAALLYTLQLQREEIKLNRTEIALNRNELSKSVKAQQESQEALKQQVTQTHLTAQLNAMNTVISYYNSQIESSKSTQETIDKARAKRRLIIQKIDDLIDELDDLDVE